MRAARPETTSPIDRLARRARWVMTFERLWPSLVLAMVLGALFVALSWLGLWLAVPRLLRMFGVALFAAGLGWAVVLAWRRLPVTRSEVLRRLDRDSGQPHRPLSGSEDRLANATDDPMTAALWALSRQRLEAVVRGVRVAPPSPRLVERDPFGLRAAALLVLVAAAFVAGPEKDGLLGTAFDWRGGGPAVPGSRVDAWIDPPGYTGRPPIVLFASNAAGKTDAQEVTAPVRSTIVVRASGAGALDVRTDGALKAARAEAKPGAPPAPADGKPAAAERRLEIDGAGTLTVVHDGTTFGPVAIKAIPDHPPTISLVGPPAPTARGGLTLAYRIADDYGVADAEATFADPVPPPGAGPMVRSLVPPPRLALSLPPTPGGLGNGQTTGDLSDHPWAGAGVALVLSTRDEGGNVGLSAPVRMTLPRHPFAKPLARALVEQRQNLVFDPDHREPVGIALDALMIDPDRFGTSKAVYLGLYTARQRLSAARTDEDLVALADYLWQIALKVEEGDLGQSARDLRAAEQALREALQRNASADEIKRLTDELRRQMDKFVAEMAQKNARDEQGRPDPNAKSVTQQDLQKMMQRMQEMAEAGNTAEAQRMLDQLQNILENLRTARQGSPRDQANREANQQMGELEKMMQEQQALRDKTFKKGQAQRRAPHGQSPGDPDEEAAPDGGDGQPQADSGDQPGDGDLSGQQKALRQRLDDVQKSMRQLGMQGEQGLDDAEQAMKEAEGALGEGPGGNRRAVDAQGRALQGLQKGASGMAQQMARGQSDEAGDGQGQGGQVGQGSSGEGGNDPLGRRREGRGQMETRGSALDEGVAARAARVLQELRRRLANPNRPAQELDYLERLLQPN